MNLRTRYALLLMVLGIIVIIAHTIDPVFGGIIAFYMLLAQLFVSIGFCIWYMVSLLLREKRKN